MTLGWKKKKNLKEFERWIIIVDPRPSNSKEFSNHPHKMTLWVKRKKISKRIRKIDRNGSSSFRIQKNFPRKTKLRWKKKKIYPKEFERWIIIVDPRASNSKEFSNHPRNTYTWMKSKEICKKNWKDGSQSWILGFGSRFPRGIHKRPSVARESFHATHDQHSPCHRIGWQRKGEKKWKWDRVHSFEVNLFLVGGLFQPRKNAQGSRDTIQLSLQRPFPPPNMKRSTNLENQRYDTGVLRNCDELDKKKKKMEIKLNKKREMKWKRKGRERWIDVD